MLNVKLRMYGTKTGSILDSCSPSIHYSTFTIQNSSPRGGAGPGDPAAHRTDRLPLLPSGPGGVHRILLHRAQPLFSKLKVKRGKYGTSMAKTFSFTLFTFA